MRYQIRLVLVVLVALATLAPVCVLSGGDTRTTTDEFEMSAGATVEVIGENAEVRVTRAFSKTLELTTTMHNAEFVDFYTQAMNPEPVERLVISATTSTGGTTTANSILELKIPAGVKLDVRTTNGSISIDAANLVSATLATTEGEISVKNSAGDYVISTTNSEVTVQGVAGSVNLETTNAHVWFDGAVDEGSNSISTTNGDIAVRLRNGSDVAISGSTRNGEVSVNGGNAGITTEGDTAQIDHVVGTGAATLEITNGPGAIHINPGTIAVFDGDS